LLPRGEQVHGERYDHGQRIKAIITDVSNQAKGPSIIVSRRSPELIRALFELEVPEIADGLVEIQNVAREPGYRSKIAVVSHASGVDPVGACVGPRGSRVRMVVSELRGEKIDIIPFNEEPARFVAKALSPARVREVLVDDEAKQATVIVPDDQLSLAIGKDGLNARLAARLTGWRVDIRSETEFAEEEATMGYAEEEVAGRCAAILANGKRCPNASLPGSRYCGLPAHQELEGKGTDYVVPPEDEGETPEGGAEEAPAAGNGAAAEEVAAEAPVSEAPVSEEPLADEPAAEAPAAEAPAAEEPVAEEPVAEEPVAEELASDAVTAGQPSADDLVSEQPSVDEVLGEQPAADEVIEDQPSVDEIVDGQPPAPALAEQDAAEVAEVAEVEAGEPAADSAPEPATDSAPEPAADSAPEPDPEEERS
jgi:N utilization substance protein A